MRGQTYAVCFVLALFPILGCTLGSGDVQFNISPKSVIEGDGQKVEMTCTDAVHSKVLMISIKKAGENVVFVRDVSKVSFTENNNNRMQATGFVPYENKQQMGSLNLTISQVTKEDGGNYTCIFHHLDGNGNLKQEIATANLVVKAPPPKTTTPKPVPTVAYTAESILSNLLDRLAQVELNGKLQPYWIIGLTEKERQELMGNKGNKTGIVLDKDALNLKALTDRLAQLESIVFTHIIENGSQIDPTGKTPVTDPRLVARVDKLEKENKDISQRIHDLGTVSPTASTVTTDIIKRVNKLEVQSSSQSTMLARLHSQSASSTAFHATFNQLDVHVKKGMTLRFPIILTLKGQGYNDGTFTAPVDGVYGFHLVIDNIAIGTCKIALKSDGKYFSMLTTGNAEDKGQTSVSSVIKLKAGQEVKVIVADVTGAVSLRGYSYSTFTGYLIWS